MLFEHVSYSLPLLKRSFHHSKERPKQKPPNSEKKWLLNGNMSSFGSSGSAGPFDDDGYNFTDGTDPVKESGSNSSPILKYHVYPSGGADGGPILPMEPEKGFALREWRRENARRLEEKEKKEKEMLGEIIEEAEVYKEEFYRKRQLAVENRKASNREKEKLFLANEEKFHGEAEQNCWKVIGELIPREVAVIEKRGKKKDEEKKTGIVVIQGPKPGKPTDMSRMRQILLKLKHNPPLHMKPKRLPSEESKTDGKGVAATAAASAATNQSTVAVAGE